MSYFAVARILDGHNQLVGLKIANYCFTLNGLASIKSYSLRDLFVLVSNDMYISNLIVNEEQSGEISVVGVNGSIDRYSAFSISDELLTEEVLVLVNRQPKEGYYDFLNPFGVPKRVYAHELSDFQSKSGIYSNNGWLGNKEYEEYIASAYRASIYNFHIANAIVCECETGKEIRYIDSCDEYNRFMTNLIPDDYFRPLFFNRTRLRMFKLPDVSGLELSDECNDDLNNIFSPADLEEESNFIKLIPYDTFINREKRLIRAVERHKKNKDSSDNLEYNAFYTEYSSKCMAKQQVMIRTYGSVPMDSNGGINTNGSNLGMYHEILVFGAFNVLTDKLYPIDKNFWGNVYIGILQFSGKHGRDFVIDLGHEDYLQVKDIVYVGKAYISLLKAYCEADMSARRAKMLFRRTYDPKDNVVIALGKIGIVFIRTVIRDRSTTDIVYDYFGDSQVCERKVKTIPYTKIMTKASLEREIRRLISSNFLDENFSLDNITMKRILQEANRATYKVYEEPLSMMRSINVEESTLYDDDLHNLVGTDGIVDVMMKSHLSLLVTNNTYDSALFVGLHKSKAFVSSLNIEFSNCYRIGRAYRCNFLAQVIFAYALFDNSVATLKVQGNHGYIESTVMGDTRLKLLDLAQSALVRLGLLDTNYKNLIGVSNYELALKAIYNIDISVEADELIIYSIYKVKFRLSEVMRLAKCRMERLLGLKPSLGLVRDTFDFLNLDVKINNDGYIVDFSGSPRITQVQGINGILFKNFMLDAPGRLTVLMQSRFDIYCGDVLRPNYNYHRKTGVVCLLYESRQLDLMHQLLTFTIPLGIDVTWKYTDGDMNFDTFYKEYSMLFLSKIAYNPKHITMSLANYMHSIYSSTYIKMTLNLVRTVFYDVDAVPTEYKKRIVHSILTEFNTYIRRYNKDGNSSLLETKKAMVKLIMASLYNEDEYKSLVALFDKKVPFGTA